jgi:hypothetical protein
MAINWKLEKLLKYESTLSNQLNEVRQLITLSKEGKFNKSASKRVRLRATKMKFDTSKLKKYLKAIEDNYKCNDRRATNKITKRPYRETKKKNGKSS